MSGNQRIPFLDLVTPHKELREELTAVFQETLEHAAFIGGRMVDEFEKSFAAFCDTKYSVGVSSGTDALRFALMAAGIGQGDIVLTVPNTFIATAEAISQAGALAQFVDVDERTYNMDPEKLREYLETRCEPNGQTGQWIERQSGKRVAAVVPVHLYGQMADLDAIGMLAERYGLTLIEDACQAHGAEYFSQRENRWRTAGSVGRAAAFSFYPGKNLGACGEGGAVTTNDLELAQKIRMLRDHGQAQKYYHDVEGYNGRLDALQAGILQVKLGRLPGWNEQRRESARRYRELLDGTPGLILPEEPVWSKAVYHLYVVRVEDRAALQKQLAEVNIGTAIHYPVPLHLQKAYKELQYSAGDFPVAEKVALEILSLPMYPGFSAEDQEHVCDRVQALLSLSTPELVAAADGQK